MITNFKRKIIYIKNFVQKVQETIFMIYALLSYAKYIGDHAFYPGTMGRYDFYDNGVNTLLEVQPHKRNRNLKKAKKLMGGSNNA